MRADDAVFVKAVAPVRAAKVGALDAVHLVLPRLGGDASRRVQRMVVGHALDACVRGSIASLRFSVTQNVSRASSPCRMFML